MKAIKKAVAYCRYSSDKQTEQSIEGQLREIEEFCKKEKIIIIEKYIDRATSGRSTENRFEFLRMIKEAETMDYDYVIVYKLDRFARSRYDSAVNKIKLKKSGKKVLSVKEQITDSPEGILLESIIEGYNEYFSAELSQKVKRGMRESVINNKAIAKPPFGLKIDENKKVVIDEKNAPTVKKIFQKFLELPNVHQTALWLNENGYRTAKNCLFNQSSLTKLLKNRIYIGEIHMSDIEETGKCEQLIDNETFFAVQKKLKQNERRPGGSNHDYKWSGYIKCLDCGGTYCGTSNGNGKYIHFYYRCSRCRKKYIREEKIDSILEKAVTDFLTDENIEKVAALAYDEYQKKYKQADATLPIKKQLSALEKQLNNAIDSILNGLYSDELKERIENMEKRKKELEQTLRNEKLKTILPIKKENFIYFLNSLKGEKNAAEILVNCMSIKDDVLTVYFNLTNENNPLNLESLDYSIKNLGECPWP